jgi:hypothetical protein
MKEAIVKAQRKEVFWVGDLRTKTWNGGMHLRARVGDFRKFENVKYK